MMDKEKIFEQGSKYANENWNVIGKPNEHDNAREDFIAGALWVVKNLGLFSVSNNEERVAVCNCSKPKYVLNEHRQVLICCGCGQQYKLQTDC